MVILRRSFPGLILFFWLCTLSWSRMLNFPHDGRQIFYQSDRDLFCFDVVSHKPQWKVDPNACGLYFNTTDTLEIRSFTPGRLLVNKRDSNVITAHDANTFQKVDTIDFANTELKAKKGDFSIIGHLEIFATDAQGRIFLLDDREKVGKTVRCFSSRERQILWSYPVIIDQSYIFAARCGDLILIFCMGGDSGITYDSDTGKCLIEKPTGLNQIICLKADDGTVLWHHPVPQFLKASRFPGPICDSTGGDSPLLACAQDDTLLILDGKTGKILKEHRTSRAIVKAAFWGSGRIVLQLDLRSNLESNLRILSTKDFSTLCERILLDPGDAFPPCPDELWVFGDTLILSNTNGTGAIDLKTMRVLWTDPDSSFAHNASPLGLVHLDFQYPGMDCLTRLLVRDPRSGSEILLHSERHPVINANPTVVSLKKDGNKSWRTCPYGHHALEEDHCTQCNAQYNRKEGVWELSKYGDDPFPRPRPELIERFPLLQSIQPANSHVYPQHYEFSKKSWWPFSRENWAHERVEFISAASREELKKTILEHLTAMRAGNKGFVSLDETLDNAREKPKTPIPEISFYQRPFTEHLQGKWRGRSLEITLKPLSPGRTRVTVKLYARRYGKIYDFMD